MASPVTLEPKFAQWAATAVTASASSQFVGLSVSPDANNIYAVGTLGNSGSYGFGNSVTVNAAVSGFANPVLIQYNKQGSPQWAQSTVSGAVNSYFNGVAVSPAGDAVYVAGQMHGTGSFGFSNGVSVTGTSSINVLLGKYDTSGNMQWAQSLVSGTSQASYEGLSVASDGSIYTAGYIVGTGAVGFGNGITATAVDISSNVLLVKYNSSGVAQWAQTTTSPDAGSESSYSAVSVSSDGSVYAVGSIYGTNPVNFGNGVTATGSSNSSSTLLIVKYNASGTPQWAKSAVMTSPFGGSVSLSSVFSGISVGSDGSVYAVGYLDGEMTCSLGNGVVATGTIATSYTPILVKYDSSGNAQWAQTSNSSGSAYLQSVSVGPDGSVYASGYTIGGKALYSFGNGVTLTGLSENNIYELLILRYDSSGNALWATTTSSASVGSSFNAAAASPDGSVYATGCLSDGTSIGLGNNVFAAGALSAQCNSIIVQYR